MYHRVPVYKNNMTKRCSEKKKIQYMQDNNAYIRFNEKHKTEKEKKVTHTNLNDINKHTTGCHYTKTI